MTSKKESTHFQSLAENLVDFGRKNGADDIEVSVYEGVNSVSISASVKLKIWSKPEHAD